MLRIEQGFEAPVFESDNPTIRGYTNYHRLVMPALAAYDLLHAGHSEMATQTKLHMVKDGSLRSATLAFESDNVKEAASNIGWVAIREELAVDTDIDAPWRIIRRADPHSLYEGAAVWAATRNIIKLPVGAADDSSTRVRERYTLTALDHVDENDIRRLLVDNDAPDDVMLATATVYAINKTVPKPEYNRVQVDMTKYPALHQHMSKD